MGTHRIAQVGELVRHELSALLLTEVELPKEILVTITRVEVSPDGQHAKVFISVLPAEQTEATVKLLRQQARHLQYMLHKKVPIRPFPHIHFAIDVVGQKASAIEELLDSLIDQLPPAE